MKIAIFCISCLSLVSVKGQITNEQLTLNKWLIKSSYLIPESGSIISKAEFHPEGWLSVETPSTVLNALVKSGIYADPRIGLNSLKIPDASDEFNSKNDLSKFSYLPENRNPWKDPYWFRTEFVFKNRVAETQQMWLNLDGINYRADIWINGKLVADREEIAGFFRRFRLNISDYILLKEKNCLAIKIYPVDHPGEPDLQLSSLGQPREHRKDIRKDVTYTASVGYDCMPSIPDRCMGLWQGVFIDWTGAIDMKNPFIETDLPLPDTSWAKLKISTELVNTNSSRIQGILKGKIIGTDLSFEQLVELDKNEAKTVVVAKELVLQNPSLWWPVNYGKQPLYELELEFQVENGQNKEGFKPFRSAYRRIKFGVREISSKVHWFEGTPGLRIQINGQNIFSQGGWLQPELLLDMPRERMEAEIRYLIEANLNTVTFEDIPAPNEAFFELCDKYGLLYWMSFYGTYWIEPGRNLPVDRKLLNQNGVDLIKRYRNHPSIILYSCVGEGAPDKEIYLAWRSDIKQLDTSRLIIPTIDVREYYEWIKDDLPTGLHDENTFWNIEPVSYYQRVRAGGKWMFNTETSIATLPPVSSLKKFIPGLFNNALRGDQNIHPNDSVWAHHDASFYIKDFDPAIRLYYGSPSNIIDYVWKSQLLSVERHKAWSEAVNHRMWDITSGVWQWKLNSCWPSVGWQIYDWYLKPLSSLYSYKGAFEPLHIQLSYLDGKVTLINRTLVPIPNVVVEAKVYDSNMQIIWEREVRSKIEQNAYKDVFEIPPLRDLTSVYFVKLILKKENKIVSDNFYWLSRTPYMKEDINLKPKGGFDLFSPGVTANFSDLDLLSNVKLNVVDEKLKLDGDQYSIKIRLKNPSDKLAFFIQLALTKEHDGDEILPIFWDNNYFSLLPGEEKEVTGLFSKNSLKGAIPKMEVGGWNVTTDYRCVGMTVSNKIMNISDTLTVSADISNTFLDGSRISLLVDDKFSVGKWAYARGSDTTNVIFKIKFEEKGKHLIKIGNQELAIVVK